MNYKVSNLKLKLLENLEDDTLKFSRFSNYAIENEIFLTTKKKKNVLYIIYSDY